MPAIGAAVRSRSSVVVLEALLCALAAVPLALVAAATVRAIEGDTPLELPWDAGLVEPYVAAALSTLALVGAAQFLRRRPAPG